MADHFAPYGGHAAMTKVINNLFLKVSEDRTVKHYFFNIMLENVIHDQDNFCSFVLPKSENFYRQGASQTASKDINVKVAVFESILKTFDHELQDIGVTWQDTPRLISHSMEIIEETRDRANDDVKTSIDAKLVTSDAVIVHFAKRNIKAELEPSGEILISSGFGVNYPVCLRIFPSRQQIQLIGRATASGTVRPDDEAVLMHAVNKRLPFIKFVFDRNEDVPCLITKHMMTYKGDGIPMRMLLRVVKEFAFFFEEAVNADKENVLDDIATKTV